MKKLIINFTPNGMIPTKEMGVDVPITPSEIVDQAKLAYNKGVQMIHIHVKDEHGRNSSDPRIYAEVIRGIRITCPEMIICASLSGRINNTFETRSAVLDLKGIEKPDMGSLTLSSLNFINNASINTPDMIVNLLKKMNENNIKPELEVFDVGMVNYSKYLIKKGLLKAPYYYNIICGNIFSAQAELQDIQTIIDALPEGAIYSFGGLGSSQAKMNALGVVIADGVRVGLEDSIYYEYESKTLASNPMLIDRVLKLADAYGRELASFKEVKTLLKLNDSMDS